MLMNPIVKCYQFMMLESINN